MEAASAGEEVEKGGVDEKKKGKNKNSTLILP